MRRFGILFFSALIALGGCRSGPEALELTRLPSKETSLKDISRFFAAVSSADSVLVYEGLPHHAWESEAHSNERKRSDLIHFEGYPFYARPLDVSAEDERALSEIALRKGAHVPFRGYKLCGGYHPDYAVVWKTGGKVSGSLICFGCHEWKNFTPQGRLYEDLEATAYNELKAILSKYVVNRPKRADGR